MGSRPQIPYDIPLGAGEWVRLVLPHDLTTAEADRICGIIRAVAFPQASGSDAAIAPATHPEGGDMSEPEHDEATEPEAETEQAEAENGDETSDGDNESGE